MKFPDNIRTVQDRILYTIYKNAVIAKDDIHLPGIKDRSIKCEISKMLGTGFIRPNKKRELILTEFGHTRYTFILNRVYTADVTPKDILSVFTKASLPKTAQNVVQKLYPTEEKIAITHKVRHQIKKLVDEGKLVKQGWNGQAHIYALYGSRHDQATRKKKTLTDEQTDEQLAAELKVMHNSHFFKLLPGTLHAGEGKKECVY